MKFSKNQWISIVSIFVTIILSVVGWLFYSDKSTSENNSASNSGTNNGIIVGKVEVNASAKRTIVDDLKEDLNSIYEDKSKVLSIIYSPSSQEVYDFADLLKKYLIENGWTIGVFMPGFQGCNPTNGLCFFSDSIYVTGM